MKWIAGFMPGRRVRVAALVTMLVLVVMLALMTGTGVANAENYRY